MSYINTVWKLECEGWQYLYTQDRCNNVIPEVPGIYCMVLPELEGTCRIMYIGKSSNFKSRLKYPHSIETKWDQCFLCYIMRTLDYDSLEIEFIKRYRPELNKQHNG
jgi:excinuclease UvrABC nuclease subunit